MNTTADLAAQAHSSPMFTTPIVYVLAFLIAYFIPSFVAALRRRPQVLAIFTLNLLLGWTVIGWIGSLIWALTSPAKPQTIIVQAPRSEEPPYMQR